MKKITKSFLVIILTLIFCTVFLISCKAANAKTATFGNHTEISFYDALMSYEDFLLGMIKAGADEDYIQTEEFKKEFEEYKNSLEVEVKIEEGWRASDQLNENKLNSDEKAITYSLEVTIKDEDEIEKNTIKFFMILDENDNTLRAKGMYFDEDGDYIEELSKSEAEEMISEFYSMLYAAS